MGKMRTGREQERADSRSWEIESERRGCIGRPGMEADIGGTPLDTQSSSQIVGCRCGLAALLAAEHEVDPLVEILGEPNEEPQQKKEGEGGEMRDAMRIRPFIKTTSPPIHGRTWRWDPPTRGPRLRDSSALQGTAKPLGHSSWIPPSPRW